MADKRREMRFLSHAFAASVLILSSAATAHATLGVIDNVPAATLLVPYFEVDVDADPPEPTVTTDLILSTVDSGATAHVTLWTELGVPTVNFNVVLFANNTVSIDLHALFTQGELPFSAFGDDCKNLSLIIPTTVGDFQAAHTGQQSNGLFAGGCGGFMRNDLIARGFITIDTVADCTDQTPLDATYFTADATNENVLTGSYVITTQSPANAVAASMVHLEADGFAGVFFPITFYSRFGASFSTNDDREPLPTRWNVPYFEDLTEIICFRDNIAGEPLTCGQLLLIGGVGAEMYSHRGAELDAPSISSACGRAANRAPVNSLPLAFPAKTGTVRLGQSFELFKGAETSGGGEPTLPPQIFPMALHDIHPDGLRVLQPGSPHEAFPPVLP